MHRFVSQLTKSSFHWRRLIKQLSTAPGHLFLRKLSRRSASTLGLLSVLALVLFGGPSGASAHEPHECPDGLPDAPAISGHLDQALITNGTLSFTDIFDAGKDLFEVVFNVCDGQGRPSTTGTGNIREPNQPAFTRISSPDSNACAGCHNQPRNGGGGDFVANVFVLAQALDPVTESISPEFSNSRNTLGMFGGGPIEMLAREMTAQLHTIRDDAIQQATANNTAVTVALQANGVSFGSLGLDPADGTLDTSAFEGVDADLIIKPFHQAGVVISLREFTDNAMNHHHGMQAEERFDLNSDKAVDFDADGVSHELTTGDITAVTIWQAALGTPGRMIPADDEARAAAGLGEELFDRIGCTACHVAEMRLESRFFSEPNPYNPAGTWSDTGQTYTFDMTEVGEGPHLERDGEGAVVRAYTDLKRHNLCDPDDRPDAIRHFCNEQLAQDRPDQGGKPGAEFFITRKLWDVGNSAPYGHVGDLTTISEAILAHGGEARATRDAFGARSSGDQAAIITFLNTLQVLPLGSERVVVEGAETETLTGAAETGVPSTTIIIGVLMALVILLSVAVVWLSRRDNQ